MNSDPNASVRQVAALAAQLMSSSGSRASRARPPPPPPPGMLTPMIPHAVIALTADSDDGELVTEQVDAMDLTQPTDAVSDLDVDEWEAAAAQLGTDWKLDPRALLAGTSAALPPARTPLPPPPKAPVALPARLPSLPSIPSSSPFATARPMIAPASARVAPLPATVVIVEDEPFAIPGHGAGLSPIWKARLQLAIAGLIGALITAVVFALSRAGSPDDEAAGSVTHAAAVVPRAPAAESPATPAPAHEPPDQTRRISADDLPTVPPPPDEEPASAAPRSTPAAKSRAMIAAAAPAPAMATQGTLRISSAPASNVTLDGRPLGMTPKVVKVAPGVHRVAFIGPKGRKAQTITVAAGGNAVAAVKF